MKKALNIIKNILVWLLVIIAVGMMIFTIISVTTFDRSHRSLFGYQMFIVKTDSMSATDFSAGDLIFTRKVDPATLKEGDIIAYISQNTDNFGETITHKIRRLTKDANGEPGFITYGTTTDTDDETVVTYPYVIGQYKGKLAKVGKFFAFLKTTPGYIVCILLPFLLLIIIQIVHSVRLFKVYKKEQTEKMEEEKAEIAEERRKNAEILEQLQALSQQLGVNKDSGNNDGTGEADPAQHEEQTGENPAAEEKTEEKTEENKK